MDKRDTPGITPPKHWRKGVWRWPENKPGGRMASRQRLVPKKQRVRRKSLSPKHSGSGKTQTLRSPTYIPLDTSKLRAPQDHPYQKADLTSPFPFSQEASQAHQPEARGHSGILLCPHGPVLWAQQLQSHVNPSPLLLPLLLPAEQSLQREHEAFII